MIYRPSFSPNNAFQCVKPFVMNGVAYKLGDLVETKNIEVRRLRQMYDTRIIDVATDSAKPVPKEKPKAAKPIKDAQPEAQSNPPALSGNGLRAEHRGFGRYFILDAQGTEVEGPMSKEAADARVAA